MRYLATRSRRSASFVLLALAPFLVAVQPAPVKVSIKDLAYSPQSLTISNGQSVTWTNLDTRDHTVISADSAPAPFSSPNLAPGASFTRTFTTPGTYPYGCSYHPRMSGTITVKN